jgi:hypothetical protein
MAVLSDKTEVVVLGIDGAPSPIGSEKAVAIAQRRSYLEKRAIQLLTHFRKTEGAIYGQVCASDVAVWMEAHGNGLFESNLRQFLGGSTVNQTLLLRYSINGRRCTR